MKIAAVFAYPPSRYNLGGPTALPYLLLKHAPSDATISLYYFPGENYQRILYKHDLSGLNLESSVELERKKAISRKWHSLRARRRGLVWGVGGWTPSQQTINMIRGMAPDLVWLYPHWLIEWAWALQGMGIVVTGPDCSTLHFERSIQYSAWSDTKQIKSQQRMAKAARALEREWGRTLARIHLVGQEDVRRFAQVTGRPNQAKFIRYPHHDFEPVRENLVSKHGRVRVILTGGGSQLYLGDHLNRIVQALTTCKNDLASQIEFLFIGRGYGNPIDRLRALGYLVDHHEWVDNYEEAVASSQIQLFPIAMGTGTKGKVVSALASGVLGIGSRFAFENIYIDTKTDVLQYDEPEEVPGFLAQAIADRSRMSAVAEHTAIRIREEHSPEKAAMMFWNWSLQKEMDPITHTTDYV